MSIFPPITYPTFYLLAAILVAIESTTLITTGTDRLTRPVQQKGEFWLPLLLSVILALWMGARPVSGVEYGDTINYHIQYLQAAEEGAGKIMIDTGSEWVFGALIIISQALGLDSNGFFTVIAFGYVLTATWAMKKYVPTSPYLGFLFLISSLFFLNFGLNGLRNGLACHMILLAMAFLMEDKRIIAGIIAFLALGVHRSTMLPIAAVTAAITVLRDPKYAFYIWLASIPLSLATGNMFMGFVSGLGVDDRMAAYAGGHGHESMFSKTGFRWDFLIYSAMPIAIYWYACIKKHLRDGWYNVIATTYMLSNAVWVMLIRIEYSNRFAYLSWFLIPVMMVYPLCNMKAWGSSQDKIAGIVLAAYLLLTIFLQIAVWHA